MAVELHRPAARRGSSVAGRVARVLPVDLPQPGPPRRRPRRRGAGLAPGEVAGPRAGAARAGGAGGGVRAPLGPDGHDHGGRRVPALSPGDGGPRFPAGHGRSGVAGGGARRRHHRVDAPPVVRMVAVRAGPGRGRGRPPDAGGVRGAARERPRRGGDVSGDLSPGRTSGGRGDAAAGAAPPRRPRPHVDADPGDGGGMGPARGGGRGALGRGGVDRGRRRPGVRRLRAPGAGRQRARRPVPDPRSAARALPARGPIESAPVGAGPRLEGDAARSDGGAPASPASVYGSARRPTGPARSLPRSAAQTPSPASVYGSARRPTDPAGSPRRSTAQTPSPASVYGSARRPTDPAGSPRRSTAQASSPASVYGSARRPTDPAGSLRRGTAQTPGSAQVEVEEHVVAEREPPARRPEGVVERRDGGKVEGMPPRPDDQRRHRDVQAGQDAGFEEP